MPRNPNEVELRPMSPGDHAAIVELWGRCEGIGEPETLEELTAFLTRNPDMSPVILVEGSLVAAMLCGHDGKRGYLYHVAVDPQFRGRGYARQMIDYSLKRLHELAIRRCSIHLYKENDSGELFWLHNGWRRRTDLKVMAIDL